MTANIYTLKLHDKIVIAPGWECMRVPGGWIYSFTSYNEQHCSADLSDHIYDHHSVFVPLNKQAKEEQMQALLER